MNANTDIQAELQKEWRRPKLPSKAELRRLSSILPFKVEVDSPRSEMNEKKFDANKKVEEQFTPEQMRRIWNSVHMTRLLKETEGTLK